MFILFTQKRLDTKTLQNIHFLSRLKLRLIIGIIMLILIGSLTGCGEFALDDASDKKIEVGTKSSSFVSMNYQDAVTKLKKRGFTNITAEPIDDLITGWLTKEYSVEEVSIDGTTSFRDSDRFPADAKIVIRYHTFPNDPEHSTPTPTPTPTPTAEAGKVRIGKKSSAFTDKDYHDVVNQLYSLGFRSVTLIPVDDLITGWLTKEYSVESVSINGETAFAADDVFPADATVIVRYHVFPESTPTPTPTPTPTYAPIPDGHIRVGKKSSAFVDKDYHDVVNQLYALGFETVTLIPVDDLITGWLTKEFSVEAVSINGETSFTADDVFPVDAKVIVRYHIFPDATPTPTLGPTNTPKPTSTPTPIPTPKPDLFYYSGSKDDVKKGSLGIYSYIRYGEYDVYLVINFDEGYVYSFTDQDGDNTCTRGKIISGSLNDSMVVKFQAGKDDWAEEWTNWIHFKYKNMPSNLIHVDSNGQTYTELTPTNLNSALNLLENKKIQ